MKTSDGCGDSPKPSEIPFQAHLVALCIPRRSKKASGENTYPLKGCENSLGVILNKDKKSDQVKSQDKHVISVVFT